MSLTIDVSGAGNAYAQQVMNEVRGNPVDGEVPHADEQIGNGLAENERPADGVLMRALQQIRREAGPSHAAYLSDIVVAKDVNLRLDHSDEVDGGVSTHVMDDDWVEVDFASDIGRPAGGSRDDASAVRAQQTMAALEQVSVDDVRAAYADFLANLPEDMDENQKKAALRTLLTETGGEGVRGTVTDAIKAQVKLMENLYGACFQQVEPDRALLRAANRSIRCADALVDLVTRVALAPDGAVPLQGTSVAEALGQEMLPEDVGLRRETTEKVVRIFDEQLSDFNRLYDTLSAGSGNVSAEQFRQLEGGLAKAKKLLEQAQDGVLLKGGRNQGDVEFQNLDRDVLRQLETRVGEMSNRIEALKTEALYEAAWEIRGSFPLDILDSPLFDDRYADRFIDKYCETLDEAVRQDTKRKLGDYQTAMKNFKVEMDDAVKTGRPNKAFEIFRNIARMNHKVIVRYVKDVQFDPETRQAERLPEITSDHRSWLTDRMTRLATMTEDDVWSGAVILSRLADMVKNVKSENVPVVSGALLTRVMDGSCGLSTAALSVAWGEDATMLRPGIDDRFLISSKTLGSGFCNTVKLCSYRQPDGSRQHRVFKSELHARVSLGEIESSERIKRYGAVQKVSMINVSVCRMASLLGLGNCVVDAHVGVHGGQFGLMMEVADGVTGCSLCEAFMRGDPDKRVGSKTVGELRAILNNRGDEAKKFIGNLRHALTDLDWLDHIVGQIDRHYDNYMISVGDDLSVTLKGIDNDMSFSPYNEGMSDERGYPPAISRSTYDRLGQLANTINGLTDSAAVRRWFRESDQLGMTGLTDAQLDKTAERIRAAWSQAQQCTVFESDEDWYDLDRMKDQIDTVRSKQQACDYFTRDVADRDMFLRGGLSDDGVLTDWWGEKVFRKGLKRFESMRKVMNAEDLEAMFQSLQNDEPPVSLTELKAHFVALARKPLSASRYIDPWPENNDEGAILRGLVESCRKAKDKVLKNLQEVHIELPNDEQESCMQLYFADGFDGNVKTFRNVFDVVYKHPAFARQEIKNLFKFGGGLDWVSFVTECKKGVPFGVTEPVIAEALMSELGKPDFNPAEMDVGKLRRLVVNKFKVTPQQVPEMPATLSPEEMARFRKACAVTPAGADYYANVKAKYEELKG